MYSHNTHNRYTGICDPAVEALLESSLSAISREISDRRLPKLAGVYLGGGYGRGEGGVFRRTDGTSGLYNDLDFFVFTNRADRHERVFVDRELKKTAENWSGKLDVSVDFGPAKNIASLYKVGTTLMFQELKHGYCPVVGAPGILSILPELNPEELPPLEGLRLLLNRGMGLHLAGRCLTENPNNSGFIIRNLYKAVLGCGDALLLCARRYRWKAEERLHAFQQYAQETGIPELRIEKYREALDFKFRPHNRLPGDSRAAWNATREFWCDTVRGLVQAERESTPETVAAALHHQYGNRKWMNFPRWVIRTKSLGRPPEWLDAPIVRVLADLYEILSLAEQIGSRTIFSSREKRLYDRWQTFN